MKTPDGTTNPGPAPFGKKGREVYEQKNPKPKAPEKPIEQKNLKAEIETEKKKFEGKTEKLNKTVEKKGGWSKFSNENSGKISGTGMFLFGLFTGLLGFMFLGAALFGLD